MCIRDSSHILVTTLSYSFPKTTSLSVPGCIGILDNESGHKTGKQATCCSPINLILPPTTMDFTHQTVDDTLAKSLYFSQYPHPLEAHLYTPWSTCNQLSSTYNQLSRRHQTIKLDAFNERWGFAVVLLLLWHPPCLKASTISSKLRTFGLNFHLFSLKLWWSSGRSQIIRCVFENLIFEEYHTCSSHS